MNNAEVLLGTHGWTLECESPLEIRHEDGSFATGQAAKMVIYCLVMDEAEAAQEAAEMKEDDNDCDQV